MHKRIIVKYWYLIAIRYFCGMERLKCPLCERGGLLQANGSRVIKKSLILCFNESYIHWAIAGHHFLTRTAKNIQEENELVFSGREGQLVLN